MPKKTETQRTEEMQEQIVKDLVAETAQGQEGTAFPWGSASCEHDVRQEPDLAIRPMRIHEPTTMLTDYLLAGLGQRFEHDGDQRGR